MIKLCTLPFLLKMERISLTYLKTIYMCLLTEDTKQITLFVKNKIINGSSDWVYEEEFSLVRSFDWSHDSKTIDAYYKFDESNVKEFSMDIFKGSFIPYTRSTLNIQKLGDNSKVTLHLYDLKTE